MIDAASTARDHLVSARVALFEADLALAMANPNSARIQIDLAQAYLAEVSKSLPSAFSLQPSAISAGK